MSMFTVSHIFCASELFVFSSFTGERSFKVLNDFRLPVVNLRKWVWGLVAVAREVGYLPRLHIRWLSGFVCWVECLPGLWRFTLFKPLSQSNIEPIQKAQISVSKCFWTRIWCTIAKSTYLNVLRHISVLTKRKIISDVWGWLLHWLHDNSTFSDCQLNLSRHTLQLN